MSDRDILWYNPEVQTILGSALVPHRGVAGIARFPKGFSLPEGRVTAEGPNVPSKLRPEAHYLSWLAELIDRFADDRPETTTLASNIALFCEVRWARKDGIAIITFIDIQAFATTEGTIEDWLLKQELNREAAWEHAINKVFYHRLDYNPKNLGVPYLDGHPHIHGGLKNLPRYFGRSVDMLPTFVEYLLRMYSYPSWAAWSEQVWNRRTRLANLDARQHLSAIRKHFEAEGGYSELMSGPLSESLRAWKAAMVEERAAMYPFRHDNRIVELFDY